MKVIDTGFEGLILIEPKVFKDDRGMFYQSWRDIDYKKFGIQENFLQDNISISKKNVLRGLHYQKNQGQLVTIVFGKIFDVVVDIRSNSKTYKKYYSIELDAKLPKQLYMSPGFAHGFYVLSKQAIVSYKCTQYYNSSEEGGIIWSDPAISIDWPEGDKIISLKDQKFSCINNL